MAARDQARSNHHWFTSLTLAVSLCIVWCVVASHILGKAWLAAAVGSFVALAGYLLLAGLERVLPTGGPNKDAESWWRHLHITLINFIVAVPTGAFFGTYLAGMLADYFGFSLGLIHLPIHKPYGPLGVLATALVGIVVLDFFYYWFHRAMHRSNFLWQHHKMHHLDPQFDALTALRFNWMEYVFTGILVSLPVAVLVKTDDYSFIDAGIVNSVILSVLVLARHINHSNLRIQFGKQAYCGPVPNSIGSITVGLPNIGTRTSPRSFRCGTSSSVHITNRNGMSSLRPALTGNVTYARSGRCKYSPSENGGECLTKTVAGLPRPTQGVSKLNKLQRSK